MAAAFPLTPSDGQTAIVNVINYVYSSSATSWTRVPGTLGSFSAAGNITAGNILTTGLVSATGNVTGANINGAGTGLTGTAASLSIGGSAGTVTTAAQPNITSVGTLTSVTSSGLISTTGNVTGGDITTAGNVKIGANFSMAQSGNKLYFYYNGTAVASMDSTGAFVSANNVTAFGTP